MNMMKPSRRWFLATGVTVLTAGCRPATVPTIVDKLTLPLVAPVTLAHRFATGEVLTYQVTVRATAWNVVDGTVQEQTSVATFSCELIAEVVEAGPGAAAPLDARLGQSRRHELGSLSGLDGISVPVSVDGFNVHEVRFNGGHELVDDDGRIRLWRDGVLVGKSDSRNPISRGVAQAYDTLAPRLAGSRAEVRLAPDGSATVVRRRLDFFRDDLGVGPGLFPVGLFGLLTPSQPMKSGDTWRAAYVRTDLGGVVLKAGRGGPGLGQFHPPGRDDRRPGDRGPGVGRSGGWSVPNDVPALRQVLRAGIGEARPGWSGPSCVRRESGAGDLGPLPYGPCTACPASCSRRRVAATSRAVRSRSRVETSAGHPTR